jgi:hypothetical protein
MWDHHTASQWVYSTKNLLPARPASSSELVGIWVNIHLNPKARILAFIVERVASPERFRRKASKNST